MACPILYGGHNKACWVSGLYFNSRPSDRLLSGPMQRQTEQRRTTIWLAYVTNAPYDPDGRQIRGLSTILKITPCILEQFWRVMGCSSVSLLMAWRLEREYVDQTWHFLWSLYIIGQTIIFLPCDFYLLSFFFLSFFPRLMSAAVDWMSTILPHMVWP